MGNAISPFGRAFSEPVLPVCPPRDGPLDDSKCATPGLVGMNIQPGRMSETGHTALVARTGSDSVSKVERSRRFDA